jgi:TolB-like protein
VIAAAAFMPGWVGAAGLGALARDLSSAAQGAHIARVAVLPFVPSDDTSGGYGRSISERIIIGLVRTGGVQTVERSMLDKLLAEQGLSAEAAYSSSGRWTLGRTLSVEGLVVGSYMSRGRDLVVQARLIEVETGLVRAAYEQPVPRSGLRSAPRPAEDLRDAVAEYCVGAREQVDSIERGILELKARYWARQLRQGAVLSELRVFPGSDISDLDLRQTLYDRMNDWHSRRDIPGLSPEEMQKMSTLDRRAYLLYRGCIQNGGS